MQIVCQKIFYSCVLSTTVNTEKITIGKCRRSFLDLDQRKVLGPGSRSVYSVQTLGARILPMDLDQRKVLGPGSRSV